MAAFMTFPMSFGDVAPVSWMASATARSTTAGSAAGGRYSVSTSISAVSLSDQILAAALRELFDRVLALLDQRGHDLKSLGVVQGAAAFDLAIHEAGLEHPQRAQADGVVLAHRIGDGGVQVRDARHAVTVERRHVRSDAAAERLGQAELSGSLGKPEGNREPPEAAFLDATAPGWRAPAVLAASSCRASTRRLPAPPTVCRQTTAAERPGRLAPGTPDAPGPPTCGGGNALKTGGRGGCGLWTPAAGGSSASSSGGGAAGVNCGCWNAGAGGAADAAGRGAATVGMTMMRSNIERFAAAVPRGAAM